MRRRVVTAVVTESGRIRYTREAPASVPACDVCKQSGIRHPNPVRLDAFNRPLDTCWEHIHDAR